MCVRSDFSELGSGTSFVRCVSRNENGFGFITGFDTRFVDCTASYNVGPAGTAGGFESGRFAAHELPARLNDGPGITVESTATSSPRRRAAAAC
ncbi:MAG: hypothetical protein R3F34_03340 [Planctomycetota bacterium]